MVQVQLSLLDPSHDYVLYPPEVAAMTPTPNEPEVPEGEDPDEEKREQEEPEQHHEESDEDAEQ